MSRVHDDVPSSYVRPLPHLGAPDAVSDAAVAIVAKQEHAKPVATSRQSVPKRIDTLETLASNEQLQPQLLPMSDEFQETSMQELRALKLKLGRALLHAQKVPTQQQQGLRIWHPGSSMLSNIKAQQAATGDAYLE